LAFFKVAQYPPEYIEPMPIYGHTLVEDKIFKNFFLLSPILVYQNVKSKNPIPLGFAD
jgi:hypothetical protein